MKIIYKIAESDNVAVALLDIKKGEQIDLNGGIVIKEDIPKNLKIALKDIKKGENIVKYANIIGIASEDISLGSLVNTHNMKSQLSGTKDYKISIAGNERPTNLLNKSITFNGYIRDNGQVGIRNEIFIIPTVGCVNEICDKIAQQSMTKTGKKDIYVFKHPYGCSQLGDDQFNTQLILKGLALHPNAGGVLVVSLGCENNNLTEFKKVLGDFDQSRIRFITAQDSGDEIENGLKQIEELSKICEKDKREPVDISNLVIGLKCGGSDALSGITANSLVGVVCDKIAANNASVIMTEVPEMFGAEHILMARSKDQTVCNNIIEMINNFKEYYINNGESVSENPSPGNKEGGITSLEEKSLGCIQKGGNSIINDVIKYGEKVKEKGLTLLDGPGNDIIAQTALAAAGAHIILFTTGRGTPLGAAVPTIKISSNTALAQSKPNWIDFDAGRLLTGENAEDLSKVLLNLIIDTAQGKQTKNEINGYREIAIWKNGVTL